jgi:hypothetical protein
MKKTFLIFVTLVLSSAWVLAQEGYPQSKSSQPPPGQQSNSAQSSTQGQSDNSQSYSRASSVDDTMGAERTIQGCLQVSGTNYSLLADDGKTYALNGHSSMLHEYVGHEVQITGKSSMKTMDTTQQGAASSAKELGALKVQSVKPISDTCQSTAR